MLPHVGNNAIYLWFSWPEHTVICINCQNDSERVFYALRAVSQLLNSLGGSRFIPYHLQTECSRPGLYAGALSRGSGYSYIVGIPQVRVSNRIFKITNPVQVSVTS